MAVAGATTYAFLGWTFNPVGPSQEAAVCVANAPPIPVPDLNGILFVPDQDQDQSQQILEDVRPNVAIYCGAKVRPESYALLAQQILLGMQDSVSVQGDTLASDDYDDGVEKRGGGGVLVLQSPFNVDAFKPATVQNVLKKFPSIRCIAGHSIGGVWAMAYCQDLFNAGSFPRNEEGDEFLDFVHLGVHSSVLSLAQFKEIPFRNVGFTYATRDATLIKAAEKNDESVEDHIARMKLEELPESAKMFQIEGGNHSQYGSYGMPSYAQGLAYQDLDATISNKEQRTIIAKAIVETVFVEKGKG